MDGTFLDRPHYTLPQPLRKDGVCPHCGGQDNEAPSHLISVIVVFLLILRQHGRPVFKRELDLRGSVLTNSAIAAYWGLATNQDNGAKRGPWRITERGLRFLDGAEAIPPVVIKFRSRVVRYEGAPITVWDTLCMTTRDYEHFSSELRNGRADLNSLLPKKRKKRKKP